VVSFSTERTALWRVAAILKSPVVKSVLWLRTLSCAFLQLHWRKSEAAKHLRVSQLLSVCVAGQGASQAAR
jgi:hypothetical protein